MSFTREIPTDRAELENQIYRMEKFGEGLERNGQRWTEEECEMLIEDYRTFGSIPILALKYQRTQLAITHRLIEMGCICGIVERPRRNEPDNCSKDHCLCNTCQNFSTCRKTCKKLKNET